MFAVATLHHFHHQLRVEYHRDRSWDRSCSCCTQPTCCDSLRVTTCVHMHLTCRSTVFANRLAFQRSRSRCLCALMMSPSGCRATAYNSAPPRRKSSGVQQTLTAPDSQDSNTSWRGPCCPCHLCTDLGIYLDADATMRTHVSKTVSCCYAA